MERKTDPVNFELHREQVTISDDRYLILYTFTDQGQETPLETPGSENTQMRERSQT